jgi:ribosomal protein L9
MKVILLKDVRGIGMHGAIKDVADGFAINKLFPGKLAEAATAEKIKQIESQSAEREAARLKVEEQLDHKVLSLKGKMISIAARATEKGGLFKAVTPGDVAKAIRAEHSLEIPETAIHIFEHIKTLGEHVALLESKSGKVEIKVAVTPAL